MGLKLTGRVAGWNSGALLVHDHGGALLAGSGYSTSDDFRAARPGWFGVIRAQLPLAEGANVGVIAGGHTQQEEPGASDGVREGIRGMASPASMRTRIWVSTGRLRRRRSSPARRSTRCSCR
jgi:hypothetical protein